MVNDEARSAVAAIWTRSRDRALARVAVLEDAVAALVEDSLREEQRAAAQREAHRLAGSVGTFGFSRASAAARQLEQTFAGTETTSPAEILRATEEVAALRGDLERERSPAPDLEGDQTTTSGAADQRLLVAVGDHRRGDDLAEAAALRGFETVRMTAVAPTWAAGDAPVAALVDLDLPDEEGFRLLEQLASSDPPVPALALTPSDAFTDRVAAVRAGARAFLAADVPPDDLLDAVEGLLEGARTTDATVLAVDDDPPLLAALEATLGTAGIRLVGVAEPPQFWAALNEHAPDLVILDLDLPGVSGDELCRVIRNDPDWAGVPILFLTASSDPETISEVFSAGADDFVKKPFAGPELLARISNRLERTRLLRTFADTDSLTGLANRRSSEVGLQRLLDLGTRHRQPVSFAVLDLDHFKQVNDDHGHAVGDAVLRRVGSLLQTAFRGEDVTARWGGEEFVLGMYGMGRHDGVQRVADVLETLREERFATPSGSDVAVSFSAGLSVYPDDADSVEGLYEAADRALYRAKEHGRDRVLPATGSATEETVDVVIVEDDDALVELLDHALTTRGYRLRHVVDGQEAATQLAGSPPALEARVVLLDVDLPGLNGLDVLRHMAAAGTLAHTRVVMLTARSSAPEVAEALELGAFDHVAKPFSVPVLMQRIRRALAS